MQQLRDKEAQKYFDSLPIVAAIAKVFR